MDKRLPPKVYTIEESRKMLGVSRNTLMKLIINKQFRAVKAERRWIVPASAIDEFLGE